MGYVMPADQMVTIIVAKVLLFLCQRGTRVDGALNATSSEARQNAVRAYVDYRGKDDTAAAANTQSQHAPEEEDSSSVILLWLAILGLTGLGATLAITALVCSI